MAFVSCTPLTASLRPATASSTSEFTTSPIRQSSPSASASSSASASRTIRMGYGDYSYLTDKTQGHTNNYYIDKFRNVQDFAKAAPNSLSGALIGRNLKGGVIVPSEGIPQLEDTPEIPISQDVKPDPRIAESEGSTYSWDVEYDNPDFAPETFASLDNPDVSSMAFAQYRSSVWEDRQAALSAMDFGAVQRVKRIIGGLDETYMLTLDGQLDVQYAKSEKIAYPSFFTPTGAPQTSIPGKPYIGSVGAIELQEKESESVVFWKGKSIESAPSYKKPAGSNAPEIPYNAAPRLSAQ